MGASLFVMSFVFKELRLVGHRMVVREAAMNPFVYSSFSIIVGTAFAAAVPRIHCNLYIQ